MKVIIPVAKLTKVDREELYSLEVNSQAIAAVRKAAEALARRAKARAPRDSGEGARSIHAEQTGDKAYFRVGWDAAHYYMKFPELGTRDQPARPFLRPAVTDIQRGR